MKGRSLAALTAVLIVLCAGYWYMVNRQSAEIRRVEAAKILFDQKPSSVHQVTIERAGERATVAVRGEGGWRIEKPFAVAPSAPAWERIAAVLVNLKNERTLYEASGADADYGLDEPYLTVSAAFGGTEPAHLKFGDLDPTQQYRYTRMNDGDVFLVNAKLVGELDKPLFDLRDRTVFTVGKEGVDWLEYVPVRPRKEEDGAAEEGLPEYLANGVELEPLTLSMHDDGKWHVDYPEPGLADQEMVGSLAQTLQFTYANEFIDDPKDYSDYGLAPPRAVVSLKPVDGEEAQSLYLGGPVDSSDSEKGIYAKLPHLDAVLVIDAIVGSLLPRDIDAFREKHIITGTATDMDWITYTYGDLHARFVNDPVLGISLSEPLITEADQVTLSNMLNVLKTAEGKGQYKLGEQTPWLAQPEIEIGLQFRGEPEPVMIKFSPPQGDDNRSYVTQDNGQITSLNANVVDSLRFTLSDLIAKRLLSFREDDVQGIRLMFDGVQYQFERGERAWRIVEPAGKVLESQADLDAIIDALRRGAEAESVETIQTPADLSVYGLNTPVIEATLTLAAEEGGQPRTLGPMRIGGNCEDNVRERYAMVEGRPEIFRVRQTIILELRDALRGVRDE